MRGYRSLKQIEICVRQKNGPAYLYLSVKCAALRIESAGPTVTHNTTTTESYDLLRNIAAGNKDDGVYNANRANTLSLKWAEKTKITLRCGGGDNQ